VRIVVAPASFKGSLSAQQAAQAMARGILTAFPKADVLQVPLADGGEGTVEILVAATGGSHQRTEVRGPLGDPVLAPWGVSGDGTTAFLEMAAASGLLLVPAERRDPRLSSTFGAGQLIRAALDLGLRRLVIGLGGSATLDGGAGMARALGVRFLDRKGRELPEGGAALADLARVDLSGLDPRLAECTIRAAYDVDTPLWGPRGASIVFGPQKGATPKVVKELEQAMVVFARVAQAATGRDVAQRPGSGAAGGLGAGLGFFTAATLESGAALVLEALGFEPLLRGADLVFTGEGRTDGQTALGKAPLAAAQVAKRQGQPVVCLSGSLGDGAGILLEKGVDIFATAMCGTMTLEKALAEAATLLEAAAARVCRLEMIGRAR